MMLVKNLNTHMGSNCRNFLLKAGIHGIDQAELFESCEGAFREDPAGAMRILFLTGDRTQGLGETSRFRDLLHYVAICHPEHLLLNLELIPLYGSPDDFLALLGTPLEGAMWQTFHELGLDKRVMEPVHYDPRRQMDTVKAYQRMVLSNETLDAGIPCLQRWAGHGMACEAASTITPPDLVERALAGEGRRLDQDWLNLPEYCFLNQNTVVIPDLSRSMQGKPRAYSMAWSLYLAERNRGYLKDLIFSVDACQMTQIQGKGFCKRLESLEDNHGYRLGMVSSTLETLKDLALDRQLKVNEMPGAILGITDRKFSEADFEHGKAYLAREFASYERLGLPVPQVVFWDPGAKPGWYRDEEIPEFYRIGGKESFCLVVLALASCNVAREAERLVGHAPRYALVRSFRLTDL